MSSNSRIKRKAIASYNNNVISICSAMNSESLKACEQRLSNAKYTFNARPKISDQPYQLKLVSQFDYDKEEKLKETDLPNWLIWLIPKSLLQHWKK